jgi:hypothetical protein
MAYDGVRAHSVQVHNGPTRHDARCCGTALHVVALTRDDGDRALVELVRCSACGLNTWRLDGTEVAKADALGALSRVFAPAGPRPAARVRRPGAGHRPAAAAPRRTAAAFSPDATAPTGLTGAAVAAPRELADLLAGWQVLGAR